MVGRGAPAPLCRIAEMRNRLLTRTIPLALTLTLALAPAAGAYNDGRGFYGATNDKVVTDAGFILIIFFPLFIFVMSMLQKALDKRKDARKAAHKAYLGNATWRGGW
jgi:preprotein translocase subunit SecG